MTINAPAAIFLAFYVVAGVQGVERRLGGTIQNDILKEYVRSGSASFRRRP